MCFQSYFCFTTLVVVIFVVVFFNSHNKIIKSENAVNDTLMKSILKNKNLIKYPDLFNLLNKIEKSLKYRTFNSTERVNVNCCKTQLKASLDLRNCTDIKRTGSNNLKKNHVY